LDGRRLKKWTTDVTSKKQNLPSKRTPGFNTLYAISDVKELTRGGAGGGGKQILKVAGGTKKVQERRSIFREVRVI